MSKGVVAAALSVRGPTFIVVSCLTVGHCQGHCQENLPGLNLTAISTLISFIAEQGKSPTSWYE